MPGRDGTGPLGQGSMTGRGMGYCAVESPADAPLPGRGPGRGFGRGGAGRGFGGGGRGRRHCFWATGSPGWMRNGRTAQARQGAPEPENQALQNRVEVLQSELDLIKKRLQEIEAGPA